LFRLHKLNFGGNLPRTPRLKRHVDHFAIRVAYSLLKARQAEIAIEIFILMRTPNRLRTFSINLSLVILALGFSALGFVSFISTRPSYAGNIFSVEHAYSVIGSTFSVLVGATFFVAAIAFRGIKPGPERLAGRIDANLI
jgi:hypothetical protein